MKGKVLTSWSLIWLLATVLFVVGGALNLSQRAYSKLPPTDGVVWVRSNALIDITGVWNGYYEDGVKSPYVWSIIQRGTSISIQDTKDAKTKSRGIFKGGKVFAQDFATQNGKLSADGMQIMWSDGVVWKKQ